MKEEQNLRIDFGNQPQVEIDNFIPLLESATFETRIIKEESEDLDKLSLRPSPSETTQAASEEYHAETRSSNTRKIDQSLQMSQEAETLSRKRKRLRNEDLDIIADKNMYCRRCKRQFSRKDAYRQHQKALHNRVITPCTSICHPPIIMPEKNDPKFSCKACKVSFCTLKGYRYHLKAVHHNVIAVPVKLRACTNLIPPNLSYRCNLCEKRFPTRYKYSVHQKITHRKQPPVLHPEIIPDQDDPNFYCKACEKSFTLKHTFWYHLRHIHDMVVKGQRTILLHPELIPDRNDPNRYCKSCEKIYKSDDSFAQHLRHIHKLGPMRYPLRQSQPSFDYLTTLLLKSAKKEEQFKLKMENTSDLSSSLWDIDKGYTK